MLKSSVKVEYKLIMDDSYFLKKELFETKIQAHIMTKKDKVGIFVINLTATAQIICGYT